MPVVPEYQFAPTGSPVELRQATPDFAAGGRAVAAGLGQLGQGVGEVAQALQVKQDQFNEAQAKTLDAQLSDRIRDTLRGPGGILTQSGVNAVNMRDDAVAAIDSHVQDVSSLATNRVQQRLLAGVAAQRRAAALDEIYSHVDGQEKVFADTASAARVGSLTRDSIDAPSDETAKAGLFAAWTEMSSTAKRNGVSPDALKGEFTKLQSSVYEGRTEALLADPKNGAAALEAYGRYAPYIIPENRPKLAETVLRANNQARVTDFGNRVARGEVNINEMAGTLPDSGVEGAPAPTSATPVRLASPLPGVSAVATDAQRFGAPRDGPNGAYTHQGLDMAAPEGTPVSAAGPGKVTFAGPQGRYGNMVEITHDDGVVTRYAHLSAIAVKDGQTVESGAQVGAVGHTGDATGPHLHYEVRVNGHPTDPGHPQAVGPGTQPAARDWTATQIATAANRMAGGDPTLESMYRQELTAAKGQDKAAESDAYDRAWKAVQQSITGPGFTSTGQIAPAAWGALSPEHQRAVTELARANAQAMAAGTDRVTDFTVMDGYETLARNAASDPNGLVPGKKITNMAAFVRQDPTVDAAKLSGPDILRIKALQVDAQQHHGMFAPGQEGTPGALVETALKAMTPPQMSKIDKANFERVVWDQVSAATRAAKAPLTGDQVRAIVGRLAGDTGARGVFGGAIPLYQIAPAPVIGAAPGGEPRPANFEAIPAAERDRIRKNLQDRRLPSGDADVARVWTSWRTQAALQ